MKRENSQSKILELAIARILSSLHLCAYTIKLYDQQDCLTIFHQFLATNFHQVQAIHVCVMLFHQTLATYAHITLSSYKGFLNSILPIKTHWHELAHCTYRKYNIGPCGHHCIHEKCYSGLIWNTFYFLLHIDKFLILKFKKIWIHIEWSSNQLAFFYIKTLDKGCALRIALRLFKFQS